MIPLSMWLPKCRKVDLGYLWFGNIGAMLHVNDSVLKREKCNREELAKPESG